MRTGITCPLSPGVRGRSSARARSSSSSLSLSDMPSSALAALAGEPLKKTRTISLSADFLATRIGDGRAVEEAALRFARAGRSPCPRAA